ncbi:MAG: alpha-amylase family glycosyl hydrolase [Opitutales bacterium]|nr:alpha-amylase family glycosyl hydrolase [Opitutales bacterium]
MFRRTIRITVILTFVASMLASAREEILEKPVVYQVFTRLFGNKETLNKPWGTIEENGVGKFADFTDTALAELRDLGITHVWYTGVPHHAVIRDYTEYGISNDDPDVVKGRAGSPYAVRDYYNVNPDLAVDPGQRMAEFEALIQRTHDAGMKVIIDIVPNHVARGYKSLNRPAGVEDFGASDDTSLEYAKDNNFYYIPGEPFQVPVFPDDYQPIGGEEHALTDGRFEENPAKWTGNGARKAQPDFGDWYETVKVNYGVRPDGSYDFPELPQEYAKKSIEAHAEFWEERELPDSWYKFRDITHFWLDKGVDGFRYDMAEMVPVEFWSFLNSSIKLKNPDAFLLAEIYQPAIYRDYIHIGKMDYLYDKVDLYDTLKDILHGKSETVRIAEIQEQFADIGHNLLHFLENHDEQRIASPDFAGDPFKGLPMLVVSTALTSAPTMIYFGQEVGEDGSEEPGFGDPTRTSIFDYVGVPSHQRWMNGGKFDGGALSEPEQKLRDEYRKILLMSAREPALRGDFAEIHRYNLALSETYPKEWFAFLRWDDRERLLVVVNLSDQTTDGASLKIPAELIEGWGLTSGVYGATTVVGTGEEIRIHIDGDKAWAPVSLPAYGYGIYRF